MSKHAALRYKTRNRNERSSLNIGQPHNEVRDSWYISNPIFNKLIEFVQKNQSYDFNHVDDFLWIDLARFPIDIIMTEAKTTCCKEYRTGLLKCLTNLKKWTEKKGVRTPFSEERVALNKSVFEDVDEEERKSKEIDLNRTSSIALKNKHHMPLLDILKKSNSPEASEMIEYLEEDLYKEKDVLLKNISLDPHIEWTEVEANYSITINSEINPTLDVVKRWDATVYGYKLSLVRKSARINLSNKFSAFVDLDTNGLEIISNLPNLKNINKKVD